MWPQRWLGQTYASLHRRFGNGRFTFEDVVQSAGSRQRAKAVATRLQKIGLLYRHAMAGRTRIYRLMDPETFILMASGFLTGLTRVRQETYRRLIGLTCVVISRELRGLHSVVLYGSLARGKARATSDVDVLVVADFAERFATRLDRLILLERSPEIAEEISMLAQDGIDTHLSFLPMTPNELEALPPILLDIVDEGIPLMDDGTFSAVATRLKERLKAAGAQRVFIGEEDWYWDLKPDFKFGEVVQV
jgi:hypothetical protein